MTPPPSGLLTVPRPVSRQRLLRLLLTAVAALVLAGCVTGRRVETSKSPGSAAATYGSQSLHNEPLRDQASLQPVSIAPVTPGEPIVLLAISGGGSRSAYYTACVMEQLAHIPAGRSGRSLLDNVRVISAVSGGGLAAGYYTLHHHRRHDPEFFGEFKEAMSVNLQWRTYGHMFLFPPLGLQLAFSPMTRTDMLAVQIEKLIGAGPATFADLATREQAPSDPAPHLVLNGTVYNSGQRLAMTNLPPGRLPSVFDPAGIDVHQSEGNTRMTARLAQPLHFADLGSEIRTFRVSRAIAASAAYPIYLAPLKLRMYPEAVPEPLYGRADTGLLQSRFLYVADGGIYDNTGADTLISILRTIPKSQPVMIVIVDGTLPMETERINSSKIWGPLSVIYRMYDIGNSRPLTFYTAAAARFHDANKLGLYLIRMDSVDEEHRRTLNRIPTRFKLSGAHRHLVEHAAVSNASSVAPVLERGYRRLSGR